MINYYYCTLNYLCYNYYSSCVNFFATDQTPDLQDACCRLKNKSAHWDDIGRELGVSRNEREALYNNPNHRYCLETVLLIWLQQEGEASTWNQLLTALKSLDYFDVVQDVINFINNK